MTSNWHIPFTDFRRALDDAAAPFFRGFAHGSASVELFEPEGTDTQQPHAQDELYIVRAGTSGFVKDGKRVEVAGGDVLFVEAGLDHRFVDFSDDFSTWVIFWGPDGGETD